MSSSRGCEDRRQRRTSDTHRLGEARAAERLDLKNGLTGTCDICLFGDRSLRTPGRSEHPSEFALRRTFSVKHFS